MTSVGVCATLACLWEATAPKPGNVYHGADFEDLTYADFVTSAAVVGPIVERAASVGVGRAVREAAEATQAAVATNTNLGMLLLIVPLAAVPREKSLSAGIVDVVAGMTVDDTCELYAAIRIVQPGGLGQVQEADVHDAPPGISPIEAMRLASERDLIARQFTNGFEQVFLTADRIATAYESDSPLGEAIVKGYLHMLADYPDSLIVRKCGEDLASEVSTRAAALLESDNYDRQLAEFDLWLRADGHRRNPGTTADLVAAGLFVLLREERLHWPVRYY